MVRGLKEEDHKRGHWTRCTAYFYLNWLLLGTAKERDKKWNESKGDVLSQKLQQSILLAFFSHLEMQ